MPRPQFTLRALLVLMLVVAVCCAVWASFWSAATSVGVAAFVALCSRSEWTPFSVRVREGKD